MRPSASSPSVGSRRRALPSPARNGGPEWSAPELRRSSIESAWRRSLCTRDTMLQERGTSGPALRQRPLGPGAVPAESACSLGSAAPPPTPRADWDGQVGAHGTGAAIPPVDETVVALTLVTPGQVRHQPRQIRQALPYPRRPVRQRVVQPAGLWEAAGAGVCPARVVPGLGSSSKRVTCGGVRASMAGAARLRRQGRQRAVRTLPSQARSKREARFCRQRARTGYAAPERGRRPGAAF